MSRPSTAERLLHLAELVKYPKGQILLANGSDELQVSHVRLALELDRRPTVFKFRACAESWCMAKIVEEMY